MNVKRKNYVEYIKHIICMSCSYSIEPHVTDGNVLTIHEIDSARCPKLASEILVHVAAHP